MTVHEWTRAILWERIREINNIRAPDARTERLLERAIASYEAGTLAMCETWCALAETAQIAGRQR